MRLRPRIPPAEPTLIKLPQVCPEDDCQGYYLTMFTAWLPTERAGRNMRLLLASQNLTVPGRGLSIPPLYQKRNSRLSGFGR